MADRTMEREETQAANEKVVNALVAKLLDGLTKSGTEKVTVMEALLSAGKNGSLTQDESRMLEKFFKSSSYPVEAQMLVLTEQGWGIAIDIEKMPKEWRENYQKMQSEKGGCGDGCACGGKCGCND